MTRTYHHGDLHKAVVETALELLEEGGVEAMSIRKVANKIGVSHQAPYRHFQSKEHVLAAVRAHGFLKLAEVARNTKHKHPRSPRLQLEAAALAYVSHAVSSPALYQLMFGGTWTMQHLSEEHRDSAGEAFRSLASVVAGSPPPHSNKTKQRTQILFATLHGIVTLHANGFLGDGSRQLETLVRSACRALTSSWLES